jgi:ABC-type glycerol-3-phosphate transport system permease component
MPIIANVGRKSWNVRLLTLVMYAILAVLGVTMVVPFCITLTASVSTAMDYNRFSVAPRAVWSRAERFTRGIVHYYPDAMRGSFDQFSSQFTPTDATWSGWQAVGEDPKKVEAFASRYLALTHNPAQWAQTKLMAADYNAFASRYTIADSICSINEQDVANYYRDAYMQQVGPGKDREKRALREMGRTWGIPFESFYTVRPFRENGTPWDQQNYWPINDGRTADYARLREAYRERRFMPGDIRAKWLRYARAHRIGDPPFPVTAEASQAVQEAWLNFTSDVVPVSETRPFSMKVVWLRYLGAPSQRETLGLPAGGAITIDEYNKAFGTTYATLREAPFPLPADAPAAMRPLWDDFVQRIYPLRLVEVKTSPALSAQFRTLLQQRFKGNLARCNEVAGTQYASWASVTLPAMMPADSEGQANLWMEFVIALPSSVKILHSAETDYQAFLLKQYGSVDAVNAAYGTKLATIEQAQMPFDLAYLVTFVQNEGPLFRAQLAQNYRFVADFMLRRGHAGLNTVILILLTLLASLTINPLAAYALSRFQMKQMPAIILFMLATMAFPHAVSMIPGYLLMRDMHMLNSYWALILPGIANGMSIFLLKGFFDSLPPELYEAAALDGAKEWQVFLRITLPLSKPILAVIALNSFMGAYNSWEWALVVCQNPKMWTLAVWLYQFNSTWTSMPWAVMASFVLMSLPVFVMFLLCQNIILRGIILPQMK